MSLPTTADGANLPSPFTVDRSVVLLVDHQRGTIGWVHSLPQETVVASCRVLARMALSYDMPLVLTTTMEEVVGATIDDLQALAPEAFAGRFRRGGQLSCWDDDALRDHVAGLGRRDLILAGLTTDICLFRAAFDALRLGYRIQVVADACGTMTALGDTVTYDRLRALGATVTVVNQIVTELVTDFGSESGQVAQRIMGDEIIAKLAA